MVHRARQLVMVALMTALGFGTAQAQVDNGSSAGNARMSVSDVFVFGTQVPVQPASSTLNRNVNGIEAMAHTSGLTPNYVYTMWWVIFNSPQHCTAIPCSAADFANPRVAASVLWATGRVADGLGQATFNGHLVASNPEGVVLFGPGLQNPGTAEVHLVIRCHNAVGANGAALQDQLTTLNAGCVGPCVDVQAVTSETSCKSKEALVSSW